MKTHDLNILEQDFNDVAKGFKKAILVKDDAEFSVNDMLIQKEYFPLIDRYSGRTIAAIVTHIERGNNLPADFCILSIRVMK